MHALQENLKAIKRELLPDGQVILILETCYSGWDEENNSLLRNALGTLATIITPDDGIIEIDAAQANQTAYWDEDSRHGRFTHHLLWGLYGGADLPENGGDGNGKITLQELETFVQNSMEENRLQRGNQIDQTPSFSGAPNTEISAPGQQYLAGTGGHEPQ